MQQHSCKFHFPSCQQDTYPKPAALLHLFHPVIFLWKHALFPQFSIPGEGWKLQPLYLVRLGDFTIMSQRAHIPYMWSLNGGLCWSPENFQNLLLICFYLIFPKITKKITTFNYKLHDNYKLCMKALRPENILFEFDECVQTSS